VKFFDIAGIANDSDGKFFAVDRAGANVFVPAKTDVRGQ
jgi:hypothetical protein